jgi:recombination protein RecA
VRDVNTSGIIERFFLESPQLNFLFGGGYPIGRIIQLHGPESGGKSTLATYIGGEVQRKRKDEHNVVVYVDFERTFETTFAQKLGLMTDTDHLVFLRPENGEEAFEICQELLRTNSIGLVIWDSDTTTPSAAQINDEYGKACVFPDTEVNFRIA